MNYDQKIMTKGLTPPSLDTKALMPKQNINQFTTPKVSYFHPDIQSRIVERAKKENLIQEKDLSDVGVNRSKIEQTNSGKVDHLSKASKIVSDLKKKHDMAKEKISKLRDQASKQNEKEYSFKPQNISSGEKFIFRGSMIQRNQIWLQEKKRKQIQRKQEALVNDLEQCTFIPEISSRKMSQLYLKNKSKVNNEHSYHKQHKSPTPTTHSPIRQRKDISVTQFQSAKKQIKSRLFTIALRN